MNETDYINQQAQQFDACKDKLLERYDGLYVLFEDGEVLDSGDNRAQIAMRAYQKGGMRPLFIEKVTREPEPIRSVWTPFRGRD